MSRVFYIPQGSIGLFGSAWQYLPVFRILPVSRTDHKIVGTNATFVLQLDFRL